MINGYTDNEIVLFNAFGYANLATYIDCPSSIYRMCVEKAFTENMEGVHVEALRKAYCALTKCSPSRHTPEFEELIKF